MPKVTLANMTNFDSPPEMTILDAARQQGIVLEYSCRTGSCGVCKAVVSNGATAVRQAEVALSAKESEENYILTCCRAAISPLQLDIEDLGELGRLQVRTLPCRIARLQFLAEDVIEVTLRTPPGSKLEFLPGQYVDMIGKHGLRRSYSISNAPRENGEISLQIRKVPHGEMSRYWFHGAEVNDLLRLEGPLGTFSLRKTSARRLIFLATGTGIAPIQALLEQLSATSDFNFSQISLYWGGKTERDIYLRPEFPSLPFKFIPVLSRSQTWRGRKGHVQHVALEDRHVLGEAVVYACGSKAMINSAYVELVRAGLSSKNFYSDAFVSSNRIK